MSAVTPEASLDELLDAEEDDHLVCGCRPHLTLCGGWDPTATSVVYGVSSDKDCADCVKVWNSTGCGSCGCHAVWSCDPCRARYHASLAH